MEKYIEKNICICVYNWVTLPYSRDCQNIVNAVNQLNLKKKKKKMQQLMLWLQSDHHAVRFFHLVAIIVSAKHLRNVHQTLLSVSFSSVTQSCLPLCDPMDGSIPGFPVHQQLLEPAQTHVHRVGDTIQPCHPLSSPSPPPLQSCPASGSFQMSQFFTSGGQSIGASALVSVLPMNIQGWFP